MANSVQISVNLLNQFTGPARAIQQASRSMSESFKRNAQAAEQMSARLRRASETAARLGRTISTRVGAPMLATAGIMGRASVNFESSMLRVRSITLAADDEFMALTKSAREMGVASVFSASQAAQAQQFFAMAGFNTGQIVGALPGALDLAAAAQLGLAETADIASNILSVFNLEAEKMSNVSDILALATARSNTSVSMLGQSMKFVGPAADAAGVSLEETTALLGVLGDSGIQASMAGTSLRRAFNTLLLPTGSSAKVLRRAGIEVGTAEGKMRNFIEILQDMKEAGLSDREITAIFGPLAAGPVMQLIKGLDKVNFLTEELKENSEGVAEAMALMNIGGVAGSVQLLKSAFEELSIEIFDEETLRFIRNEITRLRGVISQFTENLTPRTKKFLAVFAVLAITLGPILMMVGKLLLMFAILAKIGIGAGIGLIAIKFLAVGGAIAAVIAGVMALVTNFDRIKEAFPILQKVIDLFRFLGDIIKSTQEGVESFFKEIVSPGTGEGAGAKAAQMLMNPVRSTPFAAGIGGAFRFSEIFGGPSASDAIDAGSMIAMGQSGVPVIVDGGIEINVNDPGGNLQSVKLASRGDVSLDMGSNFRGIS